MIESKYVHILPAKARLTLLVTTKSLAGRIPQGSQVISLTNVGVFQTELVLQSDVSLLLLLRPDSARLKGAKPNAERNPG